MSNLMVSAEKLPQRGIRAEQLQFLRFLAFLRIFLCHAEFWNFLGYPAYHCGSSSVSFFIMLSGLVTGYSCYGKEISPTLKNIAVNMWNKLRKFYPLHIITLLIAVMWSDLGQLVGNGDAVGLTGFGRNIILNLLLIQSWFRVGIGSFNGLSWFLSVMMFLYLANLPMGWLLNKINQSKYRYLIWGSLFCILWLATAGYCYATQELERGFWHYRFPPARLGEYLSCMILGYAIRSALSWFGTGKTTKICFTILEVGALLLWAYSRRHAGSYWMNNIVAWLIPNGIILTVFAFGKGWVSALFRAKPLVWLGDISFECYMLHHMIIRRYVLINADMPLTAAAQAVSFLYCLLLTIVLAALFRRVFQRTGKKA